MPNARCPACGADDRQDRIGRLWDRPQVIYHCLVCDRCYGVPDERDTLESLNDSERQVFRLTAAGWLNKQIASQAGISLRTVHLRRHSAMQKLGIKNRADLIRKAIELGLDW